MTDLKPAPCGHDHFKWPWWCDLPFCHTGPCALRKKWWKIWL